MLTPVSPQVAPAHSSSIIPVTMVTGSELSQTLMVQLPSQNEGKKPRVGQLRETQAESSSFCIESSSCVESFCTPTHITLSHTPHTLLTPSHTCIYLTLAHVHVHLGTLRVCTNTYAPHTHTLTQVAPAQSLPRSTRSGTTILVGCVTLVCPSHQN